MRAFTAILALTLLLPLVPGLPMPLDDAGSGRDAGSAASGAVPIVPGRVYDGWLTGFLLDDSDWYAFPVGAGAFVEARVSSPLGCLHLYDQNGVERDFSCSTGYLQLTPVVATATSAGTWYVEYSYLEAQHYRFSVGVGSPAPEPIPASGALLPVSHGLPQRSPASTSGGHVVVAVVDTGINPYHEFFRAPALASHPSTWLAGFPADATSLSLSLSAASRDDAVRADAAAWGSIARSSYDEGADEYQTHLYTFPGTRIVGAVSFSEYQGSTPILDEHGHGTHSAGLAAGANLPYADSDVLIVMVEVGTGDFENGVRWAARQPWIDAISASIGLRANVPLTLSPLGDRQGMEWATLEAARSGKPVFMASGNGVSGTGLAPDHCSTHTSPYTGPEWVTRIGAAAPENGNPTFWHCLPVEAIARTSIPSPDAFDLRGASSATGTSAATPNAAGHWAALLAWARASGHGASRGDALAHLLNASEPQAAAVGTNNEPSLGATAPFDQGYGLVDGAALARAKATLASGAPHARPELDAFWAADRAIRRALWGPGSATSGERPATPDFPTVADDAGSGRDASQAAPVPVAPGVVHRGTLAFPLDSEDVYTFEAVAGSTFRFSFAGALDCWSLVAPDGSTTVLDCFMLGDVQALPLTGTYQLRVISLNPNAYLFGFTLDGSPPPLPAALG